MSTPGSPGLSIIVPVYNEQDNVVPLYRELSAVLGETGESYEILFVNDGSGDETLDRLEALRDQDPFLAIVDLDGNFGEAAALSAGFHTARGEIVITMDGDGQNDPADIPRVVEALRSGTLQAVSGRRQHRQESYWLRVLPSRVANELIVRVTGIPVHDCGCGLKAYRRSALRPLHLPRGMNRFLPAILGVGAHEVAEVPTEDRRRRHGASHYGFSRTLVVMRDLLALRAIIRDPRQAELIFGIATAAAAGIGAFLLHTSVAITIVCDIVALLLGMVWWNVRRFNRAQIEGVYRLRGHQE